jgi:peptidyl-prolyl cis-trans isomerase C
MAKDPNEAIAMVNGEAILRLELDMILDKVKQKMGTKRLHLVEEKVIDDLVTQLVLKQFIRKENIQIDSIRIEEEINTFRENIRNNPDTADKTLETILEEQGGGIDELRVAMDISLSIDEYLNRTTSEEEMKEYFTENIGVFSGETVTASHILIDTRTIKDEKGLNQAKEETERLKNELDNGADFAKLAEENSDCPSAKSGGELGVIARGQMVEEFEKTAFNTEVNGISEPVKTKFGYHIIKITDKQVGENVTFEEKKEDVRLALFNEKTIALIQELNDKADVNVLYKPTPYASGGHGSMAHGSTMYGGSTGRGNPAPHAGMPMPGGSSYGGGDPHASGGSPHGGAMSSTE